MENHEGLETGLDGATWQIIIIIIIIITWEVKGSSWCWEQHHWRSRKEEVLCLGWYHQLWQTRSQDGLWRRWRRPRRARRVWRKASRWVCGHLDDDDHNNKNKEKTMMSKLIWHEHRTAVNGWLKDDDFLGNNNKTKWWRCDWLKVKDRLIDLSFQIHHIVVVHRSCLLIPGNRHQPTIHSTKWCIIINTISQNNHVMCKITTIELKRHWWCNERLKKN